MRDQWEGQVVMDASVNRLPVSDNASSFSAVHNPAPLSADVEEPAH